MPRKKESQLYHKASGFIWVKEHPTPETSTRFGQNLHSCKLQPSTRKQTNLDFDLVTTKHKKTTKPKLELEKKCDISILPVCQKRIHVVPVNLSLLEGFGSVKPRSPTQTQKDLVLSEMWPGTWYFSSFYFVFSFIYGSF